MRGGDLRFGFGEILDVWERMARRGVDVRQVGMNVQEEV